MVAGGSRMKDALILLGVCFVLSCWIFVVGHQIGLEFFERLTWAIPTAYTLTAITGGIVIAALIGAVIER